MVTAAPPGTDVLAPDRTDLLADLLAGVRTTGAAFDRSVLTGRWAMRFEDGSPLALVVPLRGPVWVRPEDGPAQHVAPDQVAVLAGGAPYVLAGDACTPPGSAVLRDGAATDDPDATVLLTGRYTVDAGAPARLLATLPPVAVVDDVDDECPVNPAVLETLAHPRPGQQVLLDRTLELMLITALRAWLTRPGAEIPAWYAAHSDPVVGPALRLLHDDLAHPWTVASLAARLHVSRAALAKRFTGLVGQPPMSYLRHQRLELVAELLRDPDMTLDTAAARVGFSSAFSLSATFKRECGVSPSAWRLAHGGSGPADPLPLAADWGQAGSPTSRSVTASSRRRNSGSSASGADASSWRS
jgi:AraC-like DNA-binding protein